MDEMTLTLSSPITEEKFDAITDVDFDNTDSIWFHTKHGKDVEFVKRKKGKWIPKDLKWECDQCGCRIRRAKPFSGNAWNYYYCPNCGADMGGGDHDL